MSLISKADLGLVGRFSHPRLKGYGCTCADMMTPNTHLPLSPPLRWFGHGLVQLGDG
jgi:hypothetical protein